MNLKKTKTPLTSAAAAVRIAIYTRKSTEEGLDQAFNSLEAQRESVEAYIRSQRGEGWIALPEKYDDGGFTGANTDRPAFQRLLTDVQAGKIDVVAVYKIDRLSRSLIDFTKTIDLFERHKVTFVSVTQQFNTTTSMGRLTLNILMSFAEFERQVISERTRDKMAASRRKGLWTGGRAVLGYSVEGKRLVINEEEAVKIRAIFDLYLQKGGFIPVVDELKRRGWTSKLRRDSEGNEKPSRHFDKSLVARILKSPLYIGKILFRGELYEGNHPAIISRKTWDAAQLQLQSNTRKRLSQSTYRWYRPLEGLLKCATCGSAMGCQWSQKPNKKRYFYYVCQTQQKEGVKSCLGSRLPAEALEAFVLERIRELPKETDILKGSWVQNFQSVVNASREKGSLFQALIIKIAFEPKDDCISICYSMTKAAQLAKIEKEIPVEEITRSYTLGFQRSVPLCRIEKTKTKRLEVSRSARLLALAHYVERQIEAKKIKNYAEAARLLGMSRARMTQIMDLLLMSPMNQTKTLEECHS